MAYIIDHEELRTALARSTNAAHDRYHVSTDTAMLAHIYDTLLHRADSLVDLDTLPDPHKYIILRWLWRPIANLCFVHTEQSNDMPCVMCYLATMYHRFGLRRDPRNAPVSPKWARPPA